MEDDLIEKERNMTMPTVKQIPLDDKINIRQIRDLRGTEILTSAINVDEYFLERLPEDTKNYDKSIKIILLGDSNVGKSSIVHCLKNDPFNNYKSKNLGLEHYNYVVKINNAIIRLQIWDTAGQEKFDTITSNYYKNTDVAIFVYAINDLNSFNKIEQWDTQLNDKENLYNNDNQNKEKEDAKKNIIKVLIGNKKDLSNEREVTFEQGLKLSELKNFTFFKEITCSLEIGENGENYIDEIISLFNNIGKKIYKEFIKNDQTRLNSSSYCYQATNSVLIEDESIKNIKLKDDDNHHSCCC